MPKIPDRSDIIHVAYRRAKKFNSKDTGNRFKLCREAALGARKIHQPEQRMEDSLNWALRLSGNSPAMPLAHVDMDGDTIPLTFQ